MKKWIAVCFLFGLSACFGGVSAPSRFYTLSPVIQEPVSEKVTASVGIDRVQVARYLDRPQIITQTLGSPEISLSETNRWIEPLSNLVQRILSEDLANALPNAPVKMKTQGREDFTYVVSVDIMKMDTVFGDKASVEAWFLIQDRSGKVIARKKASEVVPVGASFDDMAKAQSDLIGRLAVQIAREIVRLSAGG